MMHQGPGVVGPAGGISGVRSWSEWSGFASASIAAKELLPIIVATAIWWKGSVVICHCDNEALVAPIKGGYLMFMVCASLRSCTISNCD